MDKQILKDFGQRVRELRSERDLSQEQLADLSELDRTYISGIERGVRNLSLLNIQRVALALEVTPSKLLEFSTVKVSTNE